MVFENVFYAQLQEEQRKLEADLREADLRVSSGSGGFSQQRLSTLSAASADSTGSVQKQAERKQKATLEQYDLKGSWVNRTVRRAARLDRLPISSVHGY
jgi:hypothetical protein